MITILDPDVVVSLSDVQFGEEFSASQFDHIHDVSHQREGVGILNGLVIQVSVVLARSEFPFFFLQDEKEWGYHRGL